ncbi:MAG: GatB/YqeY domain-containing protein [Patescibacteria group bacterium]
MLKERLLSDVKEALKAGDSKKRTVLNSLLSAIKNRELEKRSKLSKAGATNDLENASLINDEEAIEVISSEIKKRREAIETYAQAGRPELAAQEQEELAVLIQYMPEQISDDAIRAEVKKVIAEMGLPAQAGKVIGAVMPKVKGRADGQAVSRIVKEELEKLI